MLDKDELYHQNLQDLLRVTVVLAEILESKNLTKEEERRIDYGTKILNNVTEKQKTINKL